MSGYKLSFSLAVLLMIGALIAEYHQRQTPEIPRLKLPLYWFNIDGPMMLLIGAVILGIVGISERSKALKERNKRSKN